VSLEAKREFNGRGSKNETQDELLLNAHRSSKWGKFQVEELFSINRLPWPGSLKTRNARSKELNLRRTGKVKTLAGCFLAETRAGCRGEWDCLKVGQEPLGFGDFTEAGAEGGHACISENLICTSGGCMRVIVRNMSFKTNSLK